MRQSYLMIGMLQKNYLKKSLIYLIINLIKRLNFIIKVKL